jgi:hypothetical protein
MKNKQTSISRIRIVARALEDLAEKTVFVGGATVSLYASDRAALGFSNSWYELGMKNTLEVEIAANLKVLIFQSPYFLASKFEALMDRGMSDIRYSSDFEDIIYLFDNRAELLEELKNADFAVKSYLQKILYLLLKHPIIQEAIESTVEQDFIFARATKIIQI